ncbi:MAG: hypothetical protein SWH78_05930 [Thermodesulfobacteriota bacterium]|nr:hypothetical protein [Thermodesulfobacteriota bacterium]
MTIKELVMKVQNRTGELAAIIGHLHENDVKVHGFWVGAEKKKATLRLITSDPDGAVSALTGLGLKAETVDVIAAQVPSHPGGLNTILRILALEKINIHHVYPCIQMEATVLILEVDKTGEAARVLKENWINLYDERLYKM